MTDLRKAAEMALEALEFAASEIYNEHNDDVIADAIKALRTALAQPEQFQLVCKKCGADRTKDDCKGERIKCGIMGEAQSAQPDQEPVAWTQVSDALPKSGMTVLACYKNSLGKIRRIRAHWVASKTVETSVDDDCYEYDEETDEYYLPEGWYECMDNWPEYSSVAVCEGEITHWMPLPPAPDEAYTAPPSKPWASLTDDEIFEIWEIGGTELESVRAIEAALKEKNGFL